jgi:hypothetical protein
MADLLRPSGFGDAPGAHTRPMTRIQKEVGDRLFKDGYIPDPVGCVNTDGKPVFDATVPQLLNVTEKEMKDSSKMAWKVYQLWKTSLKVERRDSIYEALTSGEYSNMSAAHHFLGTPYPVIEPHPHIWEVCVAIRWYEHVASLLITAGFYNYMRTKPVMRYSHLNMIVQKASMWFCFFFMECLFGDRAWLRLQGKIDNEAECYKYGTLETKDRLEKKVEYWQRYKAFKAEWMRRWDYHVWGQRPGERYSFLSACHCPPYPVMFCEKTDFPMRKNPFVLSARPLSEYKMESVSMHWYPQSDKYGGPSVDGHPEFKYLYRPTSTDGWNV